MNGLDSDSCRSLIPFLSLDDLVKLARCGNSALIAKFRPCITKISIQPERHLTQSFIHLPTYMRALALLTCNGLVSSMHVDLCKAFHRNDLPIDWKEICPNLESLSLATDHAHIVNTLLYETSLPKLHTLDLDYMVTITRVLELPPQLTRLSVQRNAFSPFQLFRALPTSLIDLDLKAKMTIWDASALELLQELISLESLSIRLELYVKVNRWTFIPHGLKHLTLRANGTGGVSPPGDTIASLFPSLTSLDTDIIPDDLCTARSDNWKETNCGFPATLRHLTLNRADVNVSNPACPYRRIIQCVGPQLETLMGFSFETIPLSHLPQLQRLELQLDFGDFGESLGAFPPLLTKLRCNGIDSAQIRALPKTLTHLQCYTLSEKEDDLAFLPKLQSLFITVSHPPQNYLSRLPSTLKDLTVNNASMETTGETQDLSHLTQLESLVLSLSTPIFASLDDAPLASLVKLGVSSSQETARLLLEDSKFSERAVNLRTLHISIPNEPPGGYPTDCLLNMPPNLRSLEFFNLSGTSLKRSHIQALPRTLRRISFATESLKWAESATECFSALPPYLQSFEFRGPRPADYFSALPPSLRESVD